MAREKFEDRTLTGNINVACKYDDGTTRMWTARKEDVVQHIRQIVNEYASQGYILTLRQLHYQLVTKNWIVNHDTAYKKLGSILDDCRYAGVIDWSAIEDRGRVPYLPWAVDSTDEAIQTIIDQYRRDRQEGQENLVELWTEKDALSGILKRSTSKYHIQLVVNKGYTSSSALYNAYERVVHAIKDDKRFTILYFGDHDPSGLDMVRDIRERLFLFLTRGNKLIRWKEFRDKIDDYLDAIGFTIYDAQHEELISEKTVDRMLNGDPTDKDEKDWEAARIGKYINDKELFQIIPIGLTMDQIKEYNLPPNPTKLTDSRADGYIRKFGKTCWEVDALKPQILTQLVESHIRQQIDMNVFKEMLENEKADIAKLKEMIGNNDDDNEEQEEDDDTTEE